jgi:hypothetical protein
MSEQRKVGRPRKEDLYGGHIRAAENKIADRLPDLVDNLLTLACGYWYEETTPQGKRTVYTEKPDRASNEYLLNRIMGKPVEAITLKTDESDDQPKRIALPKRRANGTFDPSANGSHRK